MSYDNFDRRNPKIENDDSILPPKPVENTCHLKQRLRKSNTIAPVKLKKKIDSSSDSEEQSDSESSPKNNQTTALRSGEKKFTNLSNKIKPSSGEE